VRAPTRIERTLPMAWAGVRARRARGLADVLRRPVTLPLRRPQPHRAHGAQLERERAKMVKAKTPDEAAVNATFSRMQHKQAKAEGAPPRARAPPRRRRPAARLPGPAAPGAGPRERAPAPRSARAALAGGVPARAQACASALHRLEEAPGASMRRGRMLPQNRKKLLFLDKEDFGKRVRHLRFSATRAGALRGRGRDRVHVPGGGGLRRAARADRPGGVAAQLRGPLLPHAGARPAGAVVCVGSAAPGSPTLQTSPVMCMRGVPLPC